MKVKQKVQAAAPHGVDRDSLVRSVQHRLRDQFFDWCSVLSLDELVENARLTRIIDEMAHTFTAPAQTGD